MWDRPLILTCRCGGKPEVRSCEWPPKVVACADCGLLMKLIAYDPKTKATAYRRFF